MNGEVSCYSRPGRYGGLLTFAFRMLLAAAFCVSPVAPPFAEAAAPYLGGTPPGGSPQAFIESLRSKSHPYVFFDMSQLDALKAKRSQPPYDAFYRSVKSYADDAVNIGIRKAGEGAEDTWIMDRAVRTMFVYQLERDSRYLQTVESFVSTISDAEIQAILADYQTVHQVLHLYATLYDLGYGHLTSASTAKLESMLERMAVRYIENLDAWNVRSYGRFPTNHATRGESDLCLLAMALPNHAEAPAWFDRCLGLLHFNFSAIAGKEGIWSEGPSYFQYGIETFYWFALAYFHLASINLFALDEPPMHAIFDSMIAIRRPDGYGPQYSDAESSHVDQTTIASFFPDSTYHYWSHGIIATKTSPFWNDGTLSPLLDFLFFQPVGSQEPPWDKTLFFTQDQVAVFRRDFSPESSFAFVRGFDAQYLNHEHHDQGSFQLWAFGAPLIVDGGYSRYEPSRNEYLTDLIYPDGHNLVLVDGSGPYKENNNFDVFRLARFASTPFLDTADVEGTYDATGWMPDGYLSDCQDIITGVPCDARRPDNTLTDVAVRRTFLYPKQLGTTPENEYLIVIDEARSTATPPARHDFSLLLHGPSTTFNRTGALFSWSTTNEAGKQVTLTGMTVASAPLGYATRSWYHFYPRYTSRVTHTRLEITAQDAERIVYLTLLYPHQEGMNAPAIVPLTGNGGSLGLTLTVGAVTDIVVANPQLSTVSVNGIETDAWIAYARYRDGLLEKASLKQGSRLAVDGVGLIQLASPTDYVIGQMDGSGHFQVVASTASPTFADVPFSHSHHDDIEALYRAGYTAGCNTDPLMYCPDAAMNRAESSVFVERGIHTAAYDPPPPATQVFADMPLDSWAAKWVNGLWQDAYTAGCGTSPLVYCPWQGHTRAEGCVFYLRMMNGANYEPPQPAQQTFVDVPLDAWYAGWVQAGYDAGLLELCQMVPEPRFCPNDPLTRALAAHMMVKAKGLPLQ